MKKRKLYISLLLAASLLTTTGCNDFLDRNLQGSLTQEEITTPEYVDNLVIAAYAYMVTGQDMMPRSAFGRMEMSVRTTHTRADSTPKTAHTSTSLR